jgi:hypothetical protein
MGYASYNRGSSTISRQIDMEQHDPLFDVIDSLNSTKKIRTKFDIIGMERKFFQPFKIGKISFGNNGWWFEDASKVGGFGYHYKTIREVLASWDIMVTGIDVTGKTPIYYTENINE